MVDERMYTYHTHFARTRVRSGFTIRAYLAHLAEEESEKGEDDEVCAASEICQLVQLESCRDREEYDLHTDCNDSAHRKVVHVQNIDRH